MPRDSAVCVACGDQIDRGKQKKGDAVLMYNGFQIPCQMIRIQSTSFVDDNTRDERGMMVAPQTKYKRLFTLLEI